MTTSPLTWLDTSLQQRRDEVSPLITALDMVLFILRSVTRLFSLSAGSSFTETCPDTPVSPAVPVPRASEAHPETLWQTAGLQQLPAASSRRWVKLGQEGIWGPQRPACGRAPGVQPGCTEDSVQLPAQFHHAPQGPDARGTAALLHSAAGKHSSSTWPPRPLGSVRNHAHAKHASQRARVYCVCACVCVCGFHFNWSLSVFCSPPQEAKSFVVWICCNFHTVVPFGDSHSNTKPLSALHCSLVGPTLLHLPDAVLKLINLYFVFSFRFTVFKLLTLSKMWIQKGRHISVMTEVG